MIIIIVILLAIIAYAVAPEFCKFLLLLAWLLFIAAVGVGVVVGVIALIVNL